MEKRLMTSQKSSRKRDVVATPFEELDCNFKSVFGTSPRVLTARSKNRRIVTRQTDRNKNIDFYATLRSTN